MAVRRPLGVNVLTNVGTAVALLATALVSVPVILHHVGLAGYGVWTLAQTMLLWATIAEAGVGPAVQRFVAVEHGAGDDTAVRRLLWSTILAYAAAGALVTGAAVLLAPALVDVFDVPAALHDDAVTMFRVAAAAIWLALLGAGLGNVQQGLERFAPLAAAAALGSVVFLAATVGLLAAGLGLVGVALAALAQQAAMLLVRGVDLARWLRPPLGLLGREQAARLGGFTLRLQMTTLSTIVNSQTDKVVVGLVASPAALGQLGIGTQVAEAGRLVSGAALSPIVSRLSVAHGAGDREGLDRQFERLHRLWVLMVIGGTVIGAAVIYPLVAAWLGDGHGQAAALGALLVVAYGLNVVTGTAVAYLRALGRPSLEARYGAVMIGANVVLTVAMGLAFGTYGVVAATTVAYALGAVWFFTAFCRSVAPPVGRVPAALLARAVAVAVLGGAAALAWGLLVIARLPAGLSLVGVALGALAAAAGYLAIVTDSPPTPAALRRLVVGGA